MKTILGSLFLTVIILSGCTTLSNQSQNKIFNYYHSVPQIDGVYWGIGIGMSLEEASENSRIDISKQLYSKVYEKIVRRKEIVEKDNMVLTNNSMLIQAEVETNTILKNVKRLDYKIGNYGYIYVLSYLNLNNNIFLDEAIVLEKLNKTYKIKKGFKTLSSAIVPGSGQIIDKYYIEGSIFAGSALVSTLGAIYGLNMMQSTYQDYLSASNVSTQQYYYSQWEEYRLLAITSGALYLVSSIISTLNYSSKNF